MKKFQPNLTPPTFPPARPYISFDRAMHLQGIKAEILRTKQTVYDTVKPSVFLKDSGPSLWELAINAFQRWDETANQIRSFLWQFPVNPDTLPTDWSPEHTSIHGEHILFHEDITPWINNIIREKQSLIKERARLSGAVTDIARPVLLAEDIGMAGVLRLPREPGSEITPGQLQSLLKPSRLSAAERRQNVLEHRKQRQQ